MLAQQAQSEKTNLTALEWGKAVSMRKLADYIRERMKQEDLTQAQLAARADLAEVVINRVVNSRRDVNLASIIAIAKGLGISPGHLLNIYADTPDPTYDPDVVRLVNKLNRLPKGFRSQLEGLADTFLKETEQYNNAQDTMKGEE